MRQRDKETKRQRAIVSFTVSIALISTQLMHQFVSRHADAEFSLKELSGIKLQV